MEPLSCTVTNETAGRKETSFPNGRTEKEGYASCSKYDDSSEYMNDAETAETTGYTSDFSQNGDSILFKKSKGGFWQKVLGILSGRMCLVINIVLIIFIVAFVFTIAFVAVPWSQEKSYLRGHLNDSVKLKEQCLNSYQSLRGNYNKTVKDLKVCTKEKSLLQQDLNVCTNENSLLQQSVKSMTQEAENLKEEVSRCSSRVADLNSKLQFRDFEIKDLNERLSDKTQGEGTLGFLMKLFSAGSSVQSSSTFILASISVPFILTCI